MACSEVWVTLVSSKIELTFAKNYLRKKIHVYNFNTVIITFDISICAQLCPFLSQLPRAGRDSLSYLRTLNLHKP